MRECDGAGAEAVPALSFEGVSFAYTGGKIPAILDLTFGLRAGEIVALVGRNGAGKSTVAQLANGLLLPEKGRVLVEGISTSDCRDGAEIRRIRALVGLLMQDPEHQIVGATVEEDVAFGLENLGVSFVEMHARVAGILERVGLGGEAATDVHQLSGGQKQRLALAGVLVLHPRVLVLDEPTSMLDPEGRAGLLEAIAEERGRGIAVLLLTQCPDEVSACDRVLALDNGARAFEGSPADFFGSSRSEQLGLGLPTGLRLARALRLNRKSGASMDEEAIAEALTKRARGVLGTVRARSARPRCRGACSLADGVPAARVSGLSVTYNRGTPFARDALRGVSVAVPAGAVTALLGPTASGKSTLLQVIGGVLSGEQGTLEVLGRPVTARHTYPRRGVGLALQRPETVLFCATVREDVSVSPRFMGVTGLELDYRWRYALALVGLRPDEFAERSPFSLSAGEQRRVALAGVVALCPRLLLLDEPGAGLDPAGRHDLLSGLVGWVHSADDGADKRQQADGEYTGSPRTMVFTTHEIEEAAEYADRVGVVAEGKVVLFGASEEVLSASDALRRYGLEPPLAARVAMRMGAVPEDRVFDADSLEAWLACGWNASRDGSMLEDPL